MIRFATFPQFIEKAQFEKLNGVVGSSRQDIDRVIGEWEKEIGLDELSNSSKDLVHAVSDFCLDVNWDYSDRMKKWLSEDRKGNEIEELKPLCREGESTHEFLQNMRHSLNGPEGVDSFMGSVMNRDKDFSPWVVFRSKFYVDDVGPFINTNNLSEQMGEAVHELDMVQKRRELRKWVNEKIAAFNSAAESSGIMTKSNERESGFYER